MQSELLRLIQNIIAIGTISETTEGKALARVKLLERVTDFYPVLSFANSFRRHFIPMRVGEQVLVVHPFGNASSGFIFRSIFNKGRKEHPLANDHTEVIDYEDGTVISYDTEAKELKVNASSKITIICKTATIEADTVTITANTTNNGDVTVDGNLSVSGGITDSRGDLTNFSTTDGAGRA